MRIPAASAPCRGLVFVWQHPLNRRRRLSALCCYLTWQFRCRLWPSEFVMPWVNGCRLIVAPGLTGATGNLYAGLHEWPDMALLLHLLRPGDRFLDVGANVGSYTVLASAAIGACSVALEPVPAAFHWLRRNLECNRASHRVTLLPLAEGATSGELWISHDRDTMNRVVEPSYPGVARRVKVVALDDLRSQAGIGGEALWKLDVEGFERQVLQGASCTLHTDPPQALLVESRCDAVVRLLSSHGFMPCDYHPLERELVVNRTTPHANQLWVRDPSWVQERLRKAPVFELLGRAI